MDPGVQSAHPRGPDPAPHLVAPASDEIAHVRAFLAGVRRHSLLASGLHVGGIALGSATLAVLLLALSAAAVGPAGFWPGLSLTVLLFAVGVPLGLGLGRPALALRREAALARLVSRAHAPVGSDLLSVVELGADLDAIAGADRVSVSLIGALATDVRERLASVPAERIVSLRPALRALCAAGAGAAALGTLAVLVPRVGIGLRTLVHRPTRFEGAAVATEPVVGDIRVSYEYPPYTRLPPRTVDGSTGDLIAVKGTRARVETRALRRVSEAALLVGERGDGELPLAIADGDRLRGEMTLGESGVYRFWLAPPIGRPVREARAHRIEVEADRPPKVEIMGPADRLELPTPRPIEVGWKAEDDFGLGAVDLVYRVGDGAEQRVPLKDAEGARATQGRTIWDPVLGIVAPGGAVSYRIEARDQDGVSGAKAGSSRTLTLVIQNPREGVSERLERQREILDKLLGDLGDRLEAALPSPAMHETEEAHVGLIGRLLDDDRREGGMGKSLRAALGGIADRLGRYLRDEAALLGGLRGAFESPETAARAQEAAKRGRPSPLWTRLAALAAASRGHVPELEKDVLLLDDLIGRQRLDELAALGRELGAAYDRLKDLMARYEATRDEALRRQLERELRELRARIAELASKIAEVKRRNDVSAEWQNMPDLKRLAAEARKLDQLLDKGDVSSMRRAMQELEDQLASLQKTLDDNAEGFGSERFSEENRALAEMRRKISDLEGDERDLQAATKEVAARQEQEIQKRLKGDLDAFVAQELEKADRLVRRANGVRGREADSVKEDLERGRQSARQLRRLLAERDVAEARSEALRAQSSLGRAAQDLDETTASEPMPSPGKSESAVRRDVGEAEALAAEIAADLAKVLPRPDELLGPQDRAQAREQAGRQDGIAQRTRDAGKEAGKRQGRMAAGGEPSIESELGKIAARMRQASDHLRRSEAREGEGAERDAADRLKKLREDLQGKDSGGSASRHRDPIRIPGADENRAPREWRQELMDAMKEKPPERFRDDVRRYYEELVR